MNNYGEKNTTEKTANQMAAAEERFDSKSLLEEIEPLLREYFIGRFDLNCEAIILNFKNGQKFRLTAEELKG